MIYKILLNDGTMYKVGEILDKGEITNILMRYVPEMNEFCFSIMVGVLPLINITKHSVKLWFEEMEKK